jgi:hypothetical protein
MRRGNWGKCVGCGSHRGGPTATGEFRCTSCARTHATQQKAAYRAGAYRDGYAGHPRLRTGGIYAEFYAMGARPPKAGKPAARFELLTDLQPAIMPVACRARVPRACERRCCERRGPHQRCHRHGGSVSGRDRFRA